MDSAVLPFYPGLEGHRHAQRTRIAHGGLWKYSNQPQLCHPAALDARFIAFASVCASYTADSTAGMCNDIQRYCHIYVIELAMGRTVASYIPWRYMLAVLGCIVTSPAAYT